MSSQSSSSRRDNARESRRESRRRAKRITPRQRAESRADRGASVSYPRALPADRVMTNRPAPERRRPGASVFMPERSATPETRSRDTRSIPRQMKTERAPAIWRGDAIPVPDLDARAEAASSAHVQMGGRVFVSWRVFSALLMVAILLIFGLMFASDSFYINTITVAGLDTLSQDDIFSLSGLRQLHLFWVDPDEVERALLTSPAIADARVEVGFPPEGVQIVIQEREPTMIWEQAGLVSWIDVQGRVMQQREERPELLRVAADPIIEGAVGAVVEIDIVTGALQLHQLLPDVPILRYHPDKGLGYNDPRGWEAWFGVGTTMPQRVTVYNAIVADLARRGVTFRELNVNDPNAPVYCCR